jgi:hypothetical protein
MYEITKPETTYLRELAKKQMEYARLPEMALRAEQWTRNNDGLPAIPPVVVETWTFDPDMMPEGIFFCTSPDARKIEYILLKNIREYELIHDDKVIPDFYPVPWKVDIDWFGIAAGKTHAKDSAGRDVGFSFDAPIRDPEQDLERLKPAAVSLDRKGTEAEANFIREALDDILPVKVTGELKGVELSCMAVSLCGMENLWTFIVDCPDAVHRLMGYLTKNQLAVNEFYEKEGLLTPNCGNSDVGQSSYGFTARLPRKAAETVKLSDVWMFIEMEETSSISPDMFREFFLPHASELCAGLGAIYYGCCEPLHVNWPDIYRAIPNIRKVSVSPWCDQRKMGELLRGTGVVFSRKPRANYLGVAKSLDEEAWRSHIDETFSAAQGNPCEVIMRDIYQVPSLETVRRAVVIAREEAWKYYGG